MKKRTRFLQLFLLMGMVVTLASAAAWAGDTVSTADADLTITGDVDDVIGTALSIGDFNGDQTVDLLIGAPGG